MAKIIIGLTGRIACGKGVIKKHLITKYHAKDYRFSTILRDILDRLHIKKSRENLQEISTLIRKNFGENTLANAMAGDVLQDSAEFIVIDGIRRMADIQNLRQMNGFKLIRVVANEQIRYERVVKRNENPGDAEKTLAEFQAEEQAETEMTIPEVMEHADFEIVNEGTFDDLEERIDDIVNLIKGQFNMN
ncbi:MAG TPA: hypothetical protein PKI61_01150 [bacterium]|nr:hypothetical protein [bacterium]HPT29721.1 hypothetical protein [bacterium]